MSSLEERNQSESDARLGSSSDSESDDNVKTTEDSSHNPKPSSKLSRCAKWVTANTQQIGSFFVNHFKSKPQSECKSTPENTSINSVDLCTSSMDIFYDADINVFSMDGYHDDGQEEVIRASNDSSFDKWTKGKMLKLLTDTHQEFNIELWCDDLEKIKEFTTQNFISSDVVAQQGLCAKNIRLEYERYQDLSNQLRLICGDFEKLYKNWWNEAMENQILKTTETVTDMQEFTDYIKPNLNQQESHMLVIGDTGVGKSSLINLILEEELMPVDAIKTTSGICEIRYSPTKSFSVAPENSTQFQSINLDFSATVSFSSALKNYIANQTSTRIDKCDRRCKLEWPVELLQSGLVLLDSPGSNDTDILTNLVMNTMKRCFVFLCVIPCGITASFKNLLTQLRDNGLTGESIFCVVTHLDDKSPEERLKAIDDVKNEMVSLFANFDKKNCVILNPKQSLHILKTYQVYDNTHFEFLRAFIPFISNILLLKLSAITDKVRCIAQRLSIKAIKYNYDLLDEEFARSVKNCLDLKERQEVFRIAKTRLETKTAPIAKEFNTSAIETVIDTFHQDKFKQKFMEAANFLKLPTDVNDSINWTDLQERLCVKKVNAEYGFFEFFGRVRDKRKLTDEYELSLLSSIYLNYQADAKNAISKVDCYKIYTQLQLIEWIDQYFTTILQDQAERTMENVWNTCSEDLQLFDNAIKESYQFLLRENANDPTMKQKYHSVLKPMITNHVKKFSGSKKAALVTVTLGLALATETAYDLVKGYTVKEIEKDSYYFKKCVAERLYERISNKLKTSDEKSKLISKLIGDPSVFLGDILNPFERAYLDIEQLSKMSALNEKTDERKKLCEKYLQHCKNVQFRFANFQAMNLKHWLLDFKQISLDSISEYKSEFDCSIVKYGILTMHETKCKVSHNVAVRSLQHKFNALQIYEETKQVCQIENANILRCYGAFVHEKIIHIVTEIWSKTLEDFLLDNILSQPRTILQMSVQLIEAIIFLLQYGVTTRMCSPIILNTNSVIISNGSQIKLNILANKADFLYQPPEYLFPKFFKNSSNPESMNIQHIIYSLGLLFYRLYHQTPEQIALFKSGKWLIPTELVGTITSAKLSLRRYEKLVTMYQQDQQFLFQTPVIDTTFSNISDTMKELIQRCYSADFICRPTLDEINAIVKFELVRLDSKLNNGINMTSILISSQKLKRYGLLAIDGGGTRGVIAAKVIQILEEKSNKKLWQLFDLAAGCSTGGLLTLSSLLRRTKGVEILELYRTLAEKVFSGRRILAVREYSEELLEEELKEHFQSITMIPDKHSPKMFVVTKRDTETTPYLLRNYESTLSAHKGESGWKCCEAARATSAAPTYFKPFWKDTVCYTDGGVGFNNPVMLLFDEAVSLLSSESKKNSSQTNDFPIIYIVSIGTGLMPNLPKPRSDTWAVTRARAAIDSAVEQATDAEYAHIKMKSICKSLNIPYYRFNPPFDERIDLDDTKQLDYLIEKTVSYMNSRDSELNELCELISKR